MPREGDAARPRGNRRSGPGAELLAGPLHHGRITLLLLHYKPTPQKPKDSLSSKEGQDLDTCW